MLQKACYTFKIKSSINLAAIASIKLLIAKDFIHINPEPFNSPIISTFSLTPLPVGANSSSRPCPKY